MHRTLYFFPSTNNDKLDPGLRRSLSLFLSTHPCETLSRTCVGLRGTPCLQRVYTLEAFTLVTAATLMGLAMGTAVAFTVTSQRALFTQLPVPFAFPWSIFGWVVAASFLSAVGASFLPATRKVRQNIASLMRSV